MRAGQGPVGERWGQPRGTYIMLPGPPRATVAPVCDCQLCDRSGFRTRGLTASKVQVGVQEIEQPFGVAVQGRKSGCRACAGASDTPVAAVAI
jgi:hypothetical protein